MSDAFDEIRRLFERDPESIVPRGSRKSEMTIAAFIDELLPLLRSLRSVSVFSRGESSLCIIAGDGKEMAENVPVPKYVFRAVCTALSRFASTHGGGEFSPYGGSHVFCFEDGQDVSWMRLDFTNTTKDQEFRVGLLKQEI